MIDLKAIMAKQRPKLALTPLIEEFVARAPAFDEELTLAPPLGAAIADAERALGMLESLLKSPPGGHWSQAVNEAVGLLKGEER